MSEYQAFYRKWRPTKFSDVVGQAHVTDTLRGAVSGGRIAHAYLFCGTRGTGKTSAAKILSRAVNCENPQNGEPCNECDTCKGILNGSILDVYEMDAASNRGVENIREIRDEVIYTPVGCKYKVYIIDEVHMLTAEAFNALLKTLEEPPGHAMFILATTEPHKIPATVLSRCQRFDFRRICVDDIAKRITLITDAENIDITPDAAELVAELGDGSMRDALSILDRCAAFADEKLTSDRIAEIIGIVGSQRLFSIADAVATDDSRTALFEAGEILRIGREPQNLLENLTDHFRNLLICKSADDTAGLLEKTAEAAVKYSAQAEKFSVERILYSIKTLGEYLAQAKWMSNPKIAVETAMVKLCIPSYSTDTDALLARIEKLERTVADLSGGVIVSAAASNNQPAATAQSASESIPDTGGADNLPPWDIDPSEEPNNAPSHTEIKVSEPAPAAVQSVGQHWEYWTEALNEIKKESKTLFAFLYIAQAEICGNDIEIEVGSKLAYDRIATPGGIDYLSKLFSRISGSRLGVKIFIKGQRKNEADKDDGFSIKDLAAKKDILGDVMDIR